MSKALSSFYSLVLPHTLGAPHPLVDQGLLVSAVEFCRRTAAVQDISTQTTTVGVSDYDVDIPAGMRLMRVLDVWLNDDQLLPAGINEIHVGTAVRGAVGSYTTRTDTPRVFYQKLPHDPVLTLYPVPKETEVDALAVRAAYEPANNATSLADTLFDDHAHAIAAGAVAYLASLPGQPFTNPKTAADFRMRFEFAIKGARPMLRSGRITRSLAVQPRKFA